MSTTTLNVKPETNPISRTPTPYLIGPAHFLLLDTDGTLAVGIGTPLDGRIRVHKLVEIEIGILFEEILRH